MLMLARTPESKSAAPPRAPSPSVRIARAPVAAKQAALNVRTDDSVRHGYFSPGVLHRAAAPRANLLQRKCACGGTCDACTDQEQMQRAARSDPPDQIPPIVFDVLRASGRSIEPNALAYFESHLGHGFAHVRVHTDAAAGASARAVNAAAYTVGRDIVFDHGCYAPDTADGKRLLAHELTHVMQQGNPAASPGDPVAIAAAGTPLEHSAEAAGEAAARGADAAPAGMTAAGILQRQGMGEVHAAEGRDAELEARAALALKGDPAPMDGKLLTPVEHTAIDALITKTGLPAATSLAEHKRLERGQLDYGVNAWIPRDSDAVVARPAFFNKWRPTTTEYEKALDTFYEPGDEKTKKRDATWKEKQAKWTERRDKYFRAAWNAATAAAQAQALDDATGAKNLAPDEISKEKTGKTLAQIAKEEAAAAKAAAAGKPVPKPAPVKGAVGQLAAGSKQDPMTTSIWAVEALCTRRNAQGTAAVAEPGKEKDLEDACQALGVYFMQREVRTEAITSVEILQAKEDTKIHDPPYTDTQYTNVAGVYLRAAHVAGRFPSITTHYLTDATAGDHYDPRCFDLGNLYGKIAALVTHPKGCTYGVIPSYGTTRGTNNVWWTDTACHRKHP
jgi:hypothetical protein